ncbi:hypothetical protein Poly24_14940 [Rosistilla carotiformis]|uniref:Uncharacterized protein n=1 Tax=Rosistilla carotiformis TaxID=2528017 RepID=A0A518JQG9_9BACT|nr:hypothetical protein [Rosistilla carotiformis]QDV67790.1 hypothetical protein Poly24_14940 [Rosistilla carotiformis]
MTSLPTSPQIPASMRVSARLKALSAAEEPEPSAATVWIDPPHAVASPTATTASLRSLAQSIVNAADHSAQTPILVPGGRVVLDPQLFVALSSELVDIARRPIRIEAFSPAAGGWTTYHLLRSHRRIVNQLAADVPYDVDVVEMNRISRPAGTSRPLFIGLATSNALLRWLPTASFYRLLILESGGRTALPEGTQVSVERFQLTAVHGGASNRN